MAGEVEGLKRKVLQMESVFKRVLEEVAAKGEGENIVEEYKSNKRYIHE